MKQMTLTHEQHELLGRMEQLFKEAKDKDISFVYSMEDGSLTAYNSANVSFGYPSRTGFDDERDEKIDWDSCSIIENASVDYVSVLDDYYLKFE